MYSKIIVVRTTAVSSIIREVGTMDTRTILYRLVAGD